MRKPMQRSQCSASVDSFRCCHDAKNHLQEFRGKRGLTRQRRGRPAFPRKNSVWTDGAPLGQGCARIIELAGLRPDRTLLAPDRKGSAEGRSGGGAPGLGVYSSWHGKEWSHVVPF